MKCGKLEYFRWDEKRMHFKEAVASCAKEAGGVRLLWNGR